VLADGWGAKVRKLDVFPGRRLKMLGARYGASVRRYARTREETERARGAARTGETAEERAAAGFGAGSEIFLRVSSAPD
jgi:hypothetical protein